MNYKFFGISLLFLMGAALAEDYVPGMLSIPTAQQVGVCEGDMNTVQTCLADWQTRLGDRAVIVPVVEGGGDQRFVIYQNVRV